MIVKGTLLIEPVDTHIAKYPYSDYIIGKELFREKDGTLFGVNNSQEAYNMARDFDPLQVSLYFQGKLIASTNSRYGLDFERYFISKFCRNPINEVLVYMNFKLDEDNFPVITPITKNGCVKITRGISTTNLNNQLSIHPNEVFDMFAGFIDLISKCEDCVTNELIESYYKDIAILE